MLIVSERTGATVFDAPRLPSLMSSAAFCKNFVVPDPLVEGIIMRGFIYALTATPGNAKPLLHC